MSIFTRLLRLFKADLHGVMDELEDQGLLLKQHLREMEDYLAQRETALNQLLTSQQQSVKELARVADKRAALEHDLTVALNKSRDDIARPLIRQSQSLRHFEEHMQHHASTMAEEVDRSREELDQRRRQYARLQLEARAYFQSTRQSGAGDWVTMVNRQWEPTNEEIEIELLQRKEALKGGV